MASRGDCSAIKGGDEDDVVDVGDCVCDVGGDLIEERAEGLRGISSNSSLSSSRSFPLLALSCSSSSSSSSSSMSISLISSSGMCGVGRGNEEARAILCIISDVHPSKPSEKEPKDSVSSEEDGASSAMLCP